MKAWLVEKFGTPDDLVLGQLPRPTLETSGENPADTLVRVDAAALNFADEIAIAGRYQDRIDPPFIAGNELAGTVVEVTGASRFKPGDRVVCQVRCGAFAEYCAIPSNRLIAIGDMPANVAVALPVSYTTAYVGLIHKARLKAGQTVLVHAAAGGLGLAGTQLAVSMGARVIACAGSEEKRRIALENGASAAIDYRQESWMDEVRDHAPQGVDIVLDPVGGKAGEDSLRLLAWHGQILVCGFASGQVPSFAMNRLLVKSASVHGVYWNFDHDPEGFGALQADLVARCARGDIKPLVRKIEAFERLREVMASLRNREIVGKVVLTWGD